jgi:hypothetical protein
MGIINETVLANIQALLNGTGIEVTALTPGPRTPDGFFATGLPTGSQIIDMPEWYIEDWHRGFGGWVVTSGRSVRFVRHRLSHDSIYTAVGIVNEEAKPPERGKRRDMRTKEVEDWIKDELLPVQGFYFQDVWEQLSVVIASSLLKIGPGHTRNAINKASNIVKKDVSQFFNSFQPVRGRIEDENTNLTKFLQYTVAMGYPEDGLPAGVSGFFRNAFVSYMVDATRELGGVRNVWGEGPFKAIASCTGKSMAGEWVTVVPPIALRETPGSLSEHDLFETVEISDLNTPLMIAAACPIGYNAKRHFRETNAIARAQKLYDPRPIIHGMKNGYEHNFGDDLEARRTEVCVLIGGLVGINLYDDPKKSGKYLNLDDIIMTDQGRRAMRAEYRKEWEFGAEEWRNRILDFMQDDGVTLKEGYELDPRMVRATSVNGNDLFTAEMGVKGPIQPDPDIIGKVFVEGLKAMAKSIRSRLIGVDRAGNEYEIDLCISGHSIKEKKMPFIPLQAMASRAGIRYWEDFENPISPRRQQRHPEEDYAQWACKHNDLVRATYLALVGQGEAGDGTVDIYSVTDMLDGNVPKRVHVGRAVVGWTRASRLYESERTGTKARKKDSMPYGTYIRMLANVELKKDPEVLRQFNIVAQIHHDLATFDEAEDDDGSFSMEPEMELV